MRFEACDLLGIVDRLRRLEAFDFGAEQFDLARQSIAFTREGFETFMNGFQRTEQADRQFAGAWVFQFSQTFGGFDQQHNAVALSI
ncbi:hypothetical protein D3C87_1474560 [compost metagenome]